METGSSVHSTLRKAMSKILGERMMQQQECCHLIAGHPTVICSHSFITLNVLEKCDVLLLPPREAPDEEDQTLNAPPADPGNDSVTKLSMPRAYSKRLDPGFVKRCSIPFKINWSA